MLTISTMLNGIMEQGLNAIIAQVLLLLAPILIGILFTVLWQVWGYVSHLLKVSKAGKYFNDTLTVLDTKLVNVWEKMEYTAVLKAKEASADGKLSKEEGILILKEAIKTAKNCMTPEEMQAIKETFKEEVEEYLQHRFESINSLMKKKFYSLLDKEVSTTK